MDIFESLENLNVSEECFDEIINIVEEIIAETSGQLRNNLIAGREHQVMVTGRKKDVTKAARSAAEAKAGKHFGAEPTAEQAKFLRAERQAKIQHDAAKDKLNRARSLVDRLNKRVKSTKDVYIDKV